MSTQSKIDYRIERLSELSGLKLKDAWLMSGEKARSHRLDTEGDSKDYISYRYPAKEFLNVLDGMINLLERMRNRGDN